MQEDGSVQGSNRRVAERTTCERRAGLLRGVPRGSHRTKPRRERRCAIAIEQIIAGHYTGTYNAVGLGYTKEGWAIHWTSHAEKIDQTDAYGRTLIELIYQGGDISIITEARVYKAGTTVPFWPWASTIGGIWSAAAPMGVRGTDVAKALVLTSVAATPAAGAPATATGSLAILSPENDQALILSSVARSVPLKWDLLPTETTGTGAKMILT